jgi:hypothetical protein
LKRSITRRTVLRGMGVSLGLPWLEATMPSTARGASTIPKSPVRLAVLYMPNGVNVSKWTPEGNGSNFTLSPTLEPLQSFKDRMVVLSNLFNAGSKVGDGHYAKEATILTCCTIRKTPGSDLCNGTSMDQVAAQRVATQTPLPSLELGVAPVAVGVDLAVGYTRIYGSHIAWSNPTTPLARELNPRAVYERLFRASTGQQVNSAKSDTLLLDLVMEDARRMRSNIGTADRLRLDEYLEVMRSIEERVQRASSKTRTSWKPRAKIDPQAVPNDQPASHAEHVRLMLDMIATAFQSDTTRVCTFMFGNAVSAISFRFLEGVTSGHHDVSHHGNDAEKLRQYYVITRWHVEQYAYLLGKLQGMREGDSTVLDNSMILFGSALSDGNSHNPHKMPLVLAGGAGGRIHTAQHLVCGEDTPAANLYVSMLDAFGTPVERFADSTGHLPGLLNA